MSTAPDCLVRSKLPYGEPLHLRYACNLVCEAVFKTSDEMLSHKASRAVASLGKLSAWLLNPQLQSRGLSGDASIQKSTCKDACFNGSLEA